MSENSYKQSMIKEFGKFIEFYNIYNTQNNQKITLNLEEEYPLFIRKLGNYIYKHFNQETWIDSTLTLNSQNSIHFSVFKGTEHENRVLSFLLQLKNAFYSSSEEEIYQFLEETNLFSNEEKTLCKEFYNRISTLNNAMKNNAFSDAENDMKNMSTYHEELKSYNEFAEMIVKTPHIQKVIQKFDSIVRQISSLKKHIDISF